MIHRSCYVRFDPLRTVRHHATVFSTFPGAGSMKPIALLLLPLLLPACASTTPSLGADAKALVEDASRIESLRRLEQQIEQAISRRDHAYLESITAPTFTRTDQEGKVEDRATVNALIRQPPPTSDVIRRTVDPASQQVQLHGDIAVTRTQVEVRGPRRAFRMTLLRVYRWRAAGWQLLSSTTLGVTPLAP